MNTIYCITDRVVTLRQSIRRKKQNCQVIREELNTNLDHLSPEKITELHHHYQELLNMIDEETEELKRYQ